MIYVYLHDMAITAKLPKGSAVAWLLFIFQLPARRASERVRVWRKLQKYGSLSWKNSAYILPHTPGNLERLQWLAAEIREYRGDASVVRVARIEGYRDREIVAMFNAARERDYDRLIRDLRLFLRSAARRSNVQQRATLGRLNHRFDEIAAADFFGSPRKKEAGALIEDLEALALEDQPHEVTRSPKAKDYHSRVWMTRPRPEVDRVGSAWLIKNFIDPKARFVFAADPQAHPGAVRFDMFEGEFTHVGDDCTFETLVKRFALKDKRLPLISQIVHDADLEDGKYATSEGKVIELILKGWGKMDVADEKILERGFELFDALYLMLKA